MEWCDLCSNAGIVPDCRGEEEGEPEGKALNFPVDLCSNPQLRDELWVSGQKNEIANASNQNEFLSHNDWAHP